MPTYEYECQRCGYTFELFQSITDTPKSTCPECRGRVRRLPGTGAGLLFKGTGFYATDYRPASYKEAAKKETAPATAKADGSAGKGVAGSESKATAKTSTNKD